MTLINSSCLSTTSTRSARLWPCTACSSSTAQRGVGMHEHLAFARRFGNVDTTMSMPPKYVEEGQHMSAETEQMKVAMDEANGGMPTAPLLAGLLRDRASQLARKQPPEIFKVVTDPSDALAFGEGWHTDLTFLDSPPVIGCLIA